MAKIVDQYIEIAKKRNPGEPEFHQTVEEVLTSIEPVLEAHPEYIESGLIERLIEPERGISFRVVWTDDNGKVHVNRGYRYEFNSALGPYKGGLRFAANVYPGIIKFLGFEQIFKNSLTGLPIGGGKGGSDFDPNGKSDAEIMRFCQAFMTEATGYGIVFFAREMLKHCGEDLKGKRVAISGFGNVTWGTATKLNELGAKVITISGPDGYILDEDGISGEKVDYLLELRGSGKNICAPYADKFPGAKFFPGKKPWEVKADLYIPCATQNEIHMEDAKEMVANGCKFLCEGSNMPTTNDALKYLMDNGVIVGPSKAANAGGVACSCIEMGQNAGHTVFSPEQVYAQLETIMVNIHKHSAEASEKYGLGYNLVAGANIAGFEKVAEAMMAQGLV